jgi:hypothetical protein
VRGTVEAVIWRMPEANFDVFMYEAMLRDAI